MVNKEIKGIGTNLKITDMGIILVTKALFGHDKEKTIPYNSIRGLDVKLGSVLTNQGNIQFLISGSPEKNNRGLFAKVLDENTFMFKRKFNKQVEEVVKYINSRISTQGTPSSKLSPADELIKLNSLKESGSISDEEYQTLKQSIIKSA